MIRVGGGATRGDPDAMVSHGLVLSPAGGKAQNEESGSCAVAIAHSDRLMRDILAAACTSRGLSVVGLFGTAQELAAQCAHLAPDVVIAGESIDGRPVDDVLDDVLEAGARVIVLSPDASTERLTNLLAKGIHGYLLYDTSPSEVATGVLAVARGAMAINHTVASVLIQQWRRLRAHSAPTGARPARSLTPREIDVLAAMVEGLATKAIARRLGVALKTVENHKMRIFEKLRVRSHAQAVTVAINLGLVSNGSRDALHQAHAG
jgi:DNA-binding NarL/FixJ family response regulator